MANRTRFKNIFILLAFLLSASSLISSCTSWLPDAHRQDVTQGNEIKREALNKIHIGMSKSEIVPILGNPTLQDPFHANRWDYFYRFVPGHQQAEQSRLTLYFEGDRLVSIDDSDYREPKPLIEEAE